jgi:hypothetical protein
MPGPKGAAGAPIFDQAMTKTLRLLKRHLRARARWTPKQLELGAIPA